MAPTLMLKGSLREVFYKNKLIGPDQKHLDDFVAIDYIMGWLEKKLARTGVENRVLILKSTTGTGKSTAFPATIFYTFFEKLNRRNIAVTEPRIFNAKDVPTNDIVPHYTREKLDQLGYKDREELKLGKNIGYRTSAFKLPPVRGIVFMTIGTLAQQLSILTDEDFMKMYSFIIIDEAHERDISIDQTMYQMKLLIERNAHKSECPFLVATSATFDVFKYADFLMESVPEKVRYQNIIHVEGLTFPVEHVFLKHDSDDVMKSIVDTIKLINDRDDPDHLPDIAVFISGEMEGKMIQKQIMNLNEKLGDRPVFPLVIMSKDITTESENFINLKANLNTLKVKGKQVARRVILGSNVMETGITIDTLGYVIDPGWYKSKEFNPSYGIDLLITKPVTQASHLQRKGRVGRRAPGKCYAMFSKEVFDNMLVSNLPKIVIENVDTFLLNIFLLNSPYRDSSIKDLGDKFLNEIPIIDLYKVKLMDMPSADSMQYSLNSLYTMGAIDEQCHPTIIGHMLSYTPQYFELKDFRAILAAYAYGISIIDMVNLIALMRFPMQIFDKEKFEVLQRKVFGDETGSTLRMTTTISDNYIENLLLFYHLGINNIKTDCAKYGIVFKSILDMVEQKETLIDALFCVGLNPYENYNRSIRTHDKLLKRVKGIKQCFYEGFKINLCKWDGDKYVNKFGMAVDISFRNRLIPAKKNVITKNDTTPTYIISHELFMRPNAENYYETSITLCSVLDGFISPDFYFDVC